jgi:hypothetical protein
MKSAGYDRGVTDAMDFIGHTRVAITALGLLLTKLDIGKACRLWPGMSFRDVQRMSAVAYRYSSKRVKW